MSVSSPMQGTVELGIVPKTVLTPGFNESRRITSSLASCVQWIQSVTGMSTTLYWVAPTANLRLGASVMA